MLFTNLGRMVFAAVIGVTGLTIIVTTETRSASPSDTMGILNSPPDPLDAVRDGFVFVRYDPALQTVVPEHYRLIIDFDSKQVSFLGPWVSSNTLLKEGTLSAVEITTLRAKQEEIWKLDLEKLPRNSRSSGGPQPFEHVETTFKVHRNGASHFYRAVDPLPGVLNDLLRMIIEMRTVPPTPEKP